VLQYASGTSASVAFSNAGTSTVNADVAANGGDGANAEAFALGVSQNLTGITENGSFGNSGTFTVAANAVAAMTTAGTGDADAFAGASGYWALDDFALDVSNSGLMDIDAMASGVNDVAARATAIQAIATGGAAAAGTIANAGTIDVFASVVGGL